MKRILLIVNPIAGQGLGKVLAPTIAAELRRTGYDIEIYLPQHQEDIRQKLAQTNGNFDLITAVGGDGTLNEIVNGLKHKIPVALVPLGTANVLAHELGLPFKAQEFVQLVRQSFFRSIDLIRANDRLGFFVLGVGFDGMIIKTLQSKRRGAIRRIHYLPLVWQNFWNYQTPNLTITVDGKNFTDISFVLIANTRYYAGRLITLSKERKLDDGLFECYMFQGQGKLALLKYLLRGISGRLLQKHDPIVTQGSSITIDAQKPVPYEIDGEYGGTTPIHIEVLPRALKILATAEKS